MATNSNNNKSLESWIWDAACSIRGAKDAPKFKDYILPLVFTKRLCDVFDDELNRIAKEVGSRAKAFKLVQHDKKLVRFYLPLQPANPAAAGGKDLTRDQFRDGSVPVAGSNGVIGFHDTANVKAPGITVGRSGSVGRVTFFTQDFWAHN